MREAFGAPLRPAVRAVLDRLRADAGARLGAEALEDALAAGRGSAPQEALAEARAVLAAPGPRTAPAAPLARHGLTAREAEVLRLVARDLSNQQIADALFLSRRTVTTHVGNILAKLGVDSRAGAAAYAVRHGLA
jgi:DNA-binding CsgD family transcriptional regulator